MKKHLFHIVKKSPWPFFISLSLFFLVTGLVFFMHRIFYGEIILLVAFLLTIYVSRQWFYNVEDEASIFGFHTLVVKKGLFKGFVLFLVSEFMLFFGFFWSFFHSALSPSIIFAFLWPFIDAYNAIHFLGFPAYNTILLIFSGITVTFAHFSVGSRLHSNALDALYITIFLGILFLISQINEYFEISYNINDSIFSSVFFMLTGLHGFHVFAGVFFLYVCLERLSNQEFTVNHYLGLVCAIWYWHFVDIIWIVLYITLYVWGNWVISDIELSFAH